MQSSISSHYRNITLITCLVIGIVFFLSDHSTDFTKLTERGKDLEKQITAVLQGNVDRQIAFLTLGIFGSIALFVAKDRRVVPVNLLGVLIATYLFWLTISILWSASPFLSAKRIIVVYLMTIGALGLSRLLSIREVWYLILVVCGSYLVIGIAVELAYGMFKPWASGYRFGGTLSHPNSQGVNLSYLILAGVCLRIVSPTPIRILWVGFLFTAVFLLLLTKSRTAIISSLIAIVCYHFLMMLARKRWLEFALLASLTLTVLCIVIWIESYSPFINDIISIGRPDSDNSTFTGRTELWKILLPEALKKPLIGYGYEGYWLDNVSVLYGGMTFGIFSSHSAYLETFLSLGLIGLVLLLTILFGGIFRAAIEMRRQSASEYAGIAALLIHALSTGFLESSITNSNLYTFLVMTAIAIVAFPPVDTGQMRD